MLFPFAQNEISCTLVKIDGSVRIGSGTVGAWIVDVSFKWATHVNSQSWLWWGKGANQRSNFFCETG